MVKVAIDTVIRSFIAYLLLLVMTRLIGRKAISQMTFFDFAVAITFGSITASLALSSQFTSFSAAVSLVFFGALAIITGYFHIKSFKFRKVVNSEPVTAVENGRIVEQNMKKVRLSIDELMSMLREKNIFNVADVEFAVIENDGQLSAMLKSQKQPLTPSDLNLPTSYKGLTKDLIIDGKIMTENLNDINLDESWLLNELKCRKIAKVEDVFFAGLDTAGNLYISEKKSRIEEGGKYGIE